MSLECSRRAFLGLGAAFAVPARASGTGRSAQPTLEAAPPVALPDTRQIDIATGGRTHRIMVAVPPVRPPARGWPVLYVLDGDLLFALTAQLMRNRFARGPDVPAQGAVVVGLGYAGAQVLDLVARTYDYTPPPAPGQPATDERGRREGGADAFLDFVETTVSPLVADAVPVDAEHRTLFGHSYGGLCTLHALFTRPGTFRNYVAASPSVWWRDGFILREQERFVAGRRAHARGAHARDGGDAHSADARGAHAPALRLLVTQGEREARPLDSTTDAARAAIVRDRRSSERLRELLEGLRDVPGLDLRFASFPGADHGSSMAPAAEQALALAIESIR